MFLLSLLGFGSNDESSGGSEDVVAALIESRSDQNEVGVYGEPHLVERGTFITEPEIEIPVKSSSPVAPLRFGLEDRALDNFLKEYDLSIDEIGEIEGKEVPIAESGVGYFAEW